VPELPEVETVRIGLEKTIVGRYFGEIKSFHPRAINPKSQLALSALTNQKIVSVHRRGKFLWIATNSELALVAHLGMSGQFRIQPLSALDEVHLRVRIPILNRNLRQLNDLRFIDQRTFGWLAVTKLESEFAIPNLVTHIALDLFDPQFDKKATILRIAAKRSEIKRVILDQSVVSGIGNIYADESLFKAKIHPMTPASSLTSAQISKLLESARLVMVAAITQGGTSFDALYVNVNGESGFFERSLSAYGQEGEPCPRCGTEIRRIAFANRSSHFCPNCQPESPSHA
jgi:formamidopyrimidine-DNA glycosylase